MERFKNRQKGGFTLVELALVLVIIGLLITGILKGEALIRNAKVKNLVNQKETLTAAFYTYYDRYNYYPGDAPNPAGNNLPVQGHNDSGNGNGQVDAAEEWILFQDLTLSQIINGGYTGAANSCPTNAFGGTALILYTTVPAINANCVIFNQIPPDVAQEIDRKYDDGVWNTGSIRADTIYTNVANKTLYWGM
jgi:prepilin-type N-terminal cleavage/methylation domain-containing protein